MVLWFSKATENDANRLSDWEHIWTQANTCYKEGVSVWSQFSRKIEEMSFQSLPQPIAEKVNKIVRGLLWTIGTLLCPTLLFPLAIGIYFVSMEKCSLDSANGIGVACAISSLSRLAGIPGPLSLLMASVNAIAAYFLLQRGGMLK